MADAGSLALAILTDGEFECATTLSDFLAANADSIDPEEAREITETLVAGRSYRGGGGASPVFELVPADEHKPKAAPPAAERGSGLPTAALADEALYLHHTSPLRSAVVALAPTARADSTTVEACRYGAGRRGVVLCRIGGAYFVLTDQEARDEARHLLINNGGPTDPAEELSNHVAGCLIDAADILERAERFAGQAA